MPVADLMKLNSPLISSEAGVQKKFIYEPVSALRVFCGAVRVRYSKNSMLAGLPILGICSTLAPSSHQ